MSEREYSRYNAKYNDLALYVQVSLTAIQQAPDYGLNGPGVQLNRLAGALFAQKAVQHFHT